MYSETNARDNLHLWNTYIVPGVVQVSFFKIPSFNASET